MKGKKCHWSEFWYFPGFMTRIEKALWHVYFFWKTNSVYDLHNLPVWNKQAVDVIIILSSPCCTYYTCIPKWKCQYLGTWIYLKGRQPCQTYLASDANRGPTHIWKSFSWWSYSFLLKDSPIFNSGVVSRKTIRHS